MIVRIRTYLALFGLLAGGTTALLVVAPGAGASTATPGQVITVQAASGSATTAALSLWDRRGDGTYFRVFGPVTAHIGAAGVGTASEGLSRTPAGVFGLTQAFGNQATNGTRLPYFRAGANDWWDENPASATYNRHVVRTSSPGGNSENLLQSGGAYAHAVVINYNTNPVVKGAGSGFFLHVSQGMATAGCVSVPSAQLDPIMRWLNPALTPVMSIGVGAAALAPVTSASVALRARATHNPVGHLDAVTVLGRSSVKITGWALDPDNRAARLIVGVHVDVTPYGHSYTGVARADVARVMKAGPRQGFSFVWTVPRGRHRICVYVADIGAGTGNPLIGCSVVSLT